MESLSDITVAFTGNRSLIPPSNIYSDDLEGVIRASLHDLLEQAYCAGKRIFLSGGAVGFDLMAAEEVVALRLQYHDVQLVLVTPFDGQDAKYPERDKELYASLLSEADRVVRIAESYSLGAYHQRNEYLVENCGELIAYSSGKGRGTVSTMRRAVKRGVQVTNIYDLIGGRAQCRQLDLEF
ncbi:MAG: SLOG family protein [Rikenellaceae bacterium]